jgi:hypothetical protein
LLASLAATADQIPASDPDVPRGDDIVILRADRLSAYLGSAVDQVALFRYDVASDSFIPIPFQVDQRLDVTFSPGTPAEFVEHDMYDVLHLDDGLLDEQDEVVFLFRDAGPKAPEATAWPTGAGVVRYETMVRDERDEESPDLRWAYLFVGSGLARSNTRYLTWSVGPTSPIVTPVFTLQYGGNWLVTGLRVAPPCGSGADLIDRLKIRSRPLGYATVDEEILSMNSEYLGGLLGPIRAIRYVRGAKSGVNTIHFDRVTRGMWNRVIHLRVHPLVSLDVYFDWLPRTDATLYRAGSTAGLPVDGVPDAGAGTTFSSWQLMRGPGGGMFVSYDLPSSSLYDEKRLYYRDDAAYNDDLGISVPYSDDDDSAYGTHGFSVYGVEACNFEPLSMTFRVTPLCSSQGSLDLGLGYFELVSDPLEVTATPQSPAVGTVRDMRAARSGLDVVLSWSAVGGASAYRVYTSPSFDFPSGSWELGGQVGTTAYRDTGEAGRTGVKAYSTVAVAPDGTEGIW